MKKHVCQTYAVRAGFPLQADFWVPDDQSGRPLVMFCHGGGWISGDRTMYQEEAEWLSGLGYPCATVSYRLAPLHPFPACIHDLQDFVQFTRIERQNLGIESDKIVAVGNSAGGHLAAMLALCDHYFGESELKDSIKVDGAVAICPITDLSDVRKNHFPISWSFIEQFVGSIDAPDEVLKAASPMSHASLLDAPMLLIHGDDDDIVPVDQSQRLFEALRATGAEVSLQILPGEGHSFTFGAWESIRNHWIEFLKPFSPTASMP